MYETMHMRDVAIMRQLLHDRNTIPHHRTSRQRVWNLVPQKALKECISKLTTPRDFSGVKFPILGDHILQFLAVASSCNATL